MHDVTVSLCSIDMARVSRKSQPTAHRRDRYDADITDIGFLVHRHRPVGWSIENLSNPRHAILVLATDGRAWYECESQHFEATRGTMLFFPPGVTHSARSDPHAPWSFYSVGFQLNPRDDASARALEQLPRHLRLDNVARLVELFGQLERQWVGRDQGRSMACRALVGLLMQHYASVAECGGRTIPHMGRLEAIVERIHCDEGVVRPVGELAAEAGLSESRFRQLFRELTGCSVTRYQNRIRIQAARDLLATGHYNVGEVAAELGFRDIYYFSRLFKRITGVPPSSCLPR